MPAVPRAGIFRLMLKRALLALPAIAGAALLATRLVPGSLPDGSTLLPSGWRIRPAGLGRLPRQGSVAVVGNRRGSVCFSDAATPERRGAVAVAHRPYTAVAGGSSLYVSDWGDSAVSVIALSVDPPRRSALFVGP